MRPPVLSVCFLIGFSQLVGTMPLKVHHVPNKRTSSATITCITIVANTLHFLWTVFILITILWLMYMQIVSIRCDGVIEFKDYMFMCEIVCSMINSTIAVVGNIYQRSQFESLSKTIHELDRKLALIFESDESQFVVIDRRLNVFVWLQMLSVLTLCLSTLVLVVIDILFVSSPTIGLLVSFLVPNIIQLMTVMQFYTLAFGVRSRYDCIAADLELAGRQMKRLSRWQDVERPYVQALANIQVRLKLAESLYRLLNMYEKSIHRSYGLLLIATLLESFLLVTIELYMFYVYVIEGFSVLALLQSITWFLLHIGKPFAALYLSTSIRDAVRMVLKSIGDISNSKLMYEMFNFRNRMWL